MAIQKVKYLLQVRKPILKPRSGNRRRRRPIRPNPKPPSRQTRHPTHHPRRRRHPRQQPRASHYASPAVYELERAGILDDAKARGIQPKDMTWRKADLTRVAGFRLDCMPMERERHSMVVLPLDQLGEILYAHLQRQPTARVRWSHRVVKVGQSEDEAWVECETPSGMRKFEAEYVLGCDGASSTVRRELFGPEYPGETLNAQLVATNVCLSCPNICLVLNLMMHRYTSAPTNSTIPTPTS